MLGLSGLSSNKMACFGSDQTIVFNKILSAYDACVLLILMIQRALSHIVSVINNYSSIYQKNPSYQYIYLKQEVLPFSKQQLIARFYGNQRTKAPLHSVAPLLSKSKHRLKYLKFIDSILRKILIKQEVIRFT